MGIDQLITFLAPWMIPAAGGSLLIVRYATKDIMVKDENLELEGSLFTSDYDELMWLAEREKGNPSDEERRRFFQLRNKWPEMHAGFSRVSF